MEKVYSRIYGIDCTSDIDEKICKASAMLSLAQLLSQVDEDCDTEDFEDVLDDFVNDLDDVTDPVNDFTTDCEVTISVETTGITCTTAEISVL